MKFSRRELLGVSLLLVGGLLVGADLWAQATSNVSNGQISQQLALGLYCDARGLISGNLGLILGLLMVFGGLWSLVSGGGWFSAILSILIGAAVPSIPGLVEGFMVGLGDLLREAKLTAPNRVFTVPTCGAARSFRQTEIDSMGAFDQYQSDSYIINPLL